MSQHPDVKRFVNERSEDPGSKPGLKLENEFFSEVEHGCCDKQEQIRMGS